MSMIDVFQAGLQMQPWSSEDEENLNGLFEHPISHTLDDIIDMKILVDSQASSGQDRVTPSRTDLKQGEDEYSARIARITGKLKDISKEGRRRRMRIIIPSFASGFILIGLAVVYPTFTARTENRLSFIFIQVLAPVGICALFVALLPSDRRAVPCAATVYIAVGIFFWVSGMIRTIRYFRDALDTGCVEDLTLKKKFPCFVSWVIFIMEVAVNRAMVASVLFYLCSRLCRLQRTESQAMLLALWWSVFVYASTYGFKTIIRAILALIFGFISDFVREGCVGVSWFSVGVLSHPRFALRSRAQSWLSSFGEGTTVAAGVAQLLGTRSAENLIAMAKNSLFYVSADVLTQEDMAQNIPNPELSRLAEKGNLGEIDAFVSHSWRDDGQGKWNSLQKWVEEFRLKQGREPKLWIDKYCIDPKNIEESLMCLPVYLSGCQQMLVLCGKTYLTRLWCLVEVFVFATMLGQQAMVEVRFLNQASDVDATPLDSLGAALQCFDSRAARCTNDYDTLRLQAVLEASGMGEHGLKELVRKVFLSGRPSLQFS